MPRFAVPSGLVTTTITTSQIGTNSWVWMHAGSCTLLRVLFHSLHTCESLIGHEYQQLRPGWMTKPRLLNHLIACTYFWVRVTHRYPLYATAYNLSSTPKCIWHMRFLLRQDLTPEKVLRSTPARWSRHTRLRAPHANNQFIHELGLYRLLFRTRHAAI